MNNNFDLIIKNDRDKRAAKEAQKYGKILCHYTSIPVLYNIINSKTLWFGNTSTMNDKLEIKFFVDELYNAVINDIDEDKKDFCRDIFSKIYSRITYNYPYAMCFSKLKDDAAQWERYADNAKGVCLVFNCEEIIKLFLQYLRTEVYYQHDIRQHQHYENLKHYINTGKFIINFPSIDAAIDNILLCAASFKHHSFAAEQEFRITTLWGNSTEFPAEYECVNGVIKEFFKVDLKQLLDKEELDFENLFENIIIAPKSNQNINALKGFLSSKGYSKLAEKVIKSDCPLQ